MTEATPHTPTHAVVYKRERGADQKAVYPRVGIAWKGKDGQIDAIQLNTMPLQGWNGRLYLRALAAPKPAEDPAQ